MKQLVLGGIKSGKSRFAETLTLKSATTTKPYYLATTEFIDEEMAQKIAIHKASRSNTFITIEEPLELYETLKSIEGTILVECMSMWLNNMLYHNKSDDEILAEVEKVMTLQCDIIFVLNDVGKSVVSENALVRKFVDLSGIISQLIGLKCDKVHYINAGIGMQLK